jgi:hypothetical protein
MENLNLEPCYIAGKQQHAALRQETGDGNFPCRSLVMLPENYSMLH